MKATPIALDHALNPDDAVDRIIEARAGDVMRLSTALRAGDSQELHDLRIAAKRLRYAMELFSEEMERAFPEHDELQQLQNVLGEIHDLDVLADMVRERAPVAHLLERIAERRRHRLDEAQALWATLERNLGRTLEDIAAAAAT